MDRKVAVLILLAWWFFWFDYKTGAATVGPFADEKTCEATRNKIGGRPWCWWDGKL